MEKLSDHDKAVLNCVFNPHLPIEDAQDISEEELKDEENETLEVLKTKKMELEAIEIAEKGELQKSLDIFNKAIEMAPQRPSLYNNRAHVYQYLRKFDEAFKDLTTVIDLCEENHKKTLCQAYCQRGILHRRAERIELARQDFEIAAKMGNKFAKSQLIELNPYAALCNQMLKQVMEKLG